MTPYERQQQIVRENIQRTYGHNELAKAIEGEELQKGKAAMIGEKRNWSGKDYVKTTQGWKMSESVHQGGKKASENIKQAGAERKKDPFKGTSIVEHEGKFYFKIGDYFLHKDGETYVKPDPDYSFPTKSRAEQHKEAYSENSSIL